MPTDQPQNEDQADMEATEDQLAELRTFGIAEADLAGLSLADAEEWIDELRMKRIDAGRFGPADKRRPRGKR